MTLGCHLLYRKTKSTIYDFSAFLPAEYEKLGLWEQAREVREKAISLRTTQKVVEVNVNQLIEQMRAGDLMATYKCPTCTAPLTVDKNSTEDSLKFCAYCGAAIQTQDIAEVISKMVK